MTDDLHTEPWPGRRLAAQGLRIAAVLIVLSGIALALFFGGAGAYFGPINDVLFAAALVLLVPALLATSRSVAAGWFTALTWLAVAALAVAVVGQLLLVIGAIALQVSFVTVGIGFLGLLAWIIGLMVLGFGGGVISRAVGWWSLAFVATLILAAAGWALVPLPWWGVLGAALAVALVGWMLVLANNLSTHAR